MMAARKSIADNRDAVKLGDMLCSPLPVEEKQDRLLMFLAEFMETAVPSLVNYRIKKYAHQTAVHIAAKFGLTTCLDILLKRGGNPNAQSSQADLCQTPLHLAAIKGYGQCIKLLIENGAHTDIKNLNNVRAITLARGKTKCEKIFKEYAPNVVPLMIRSKDEEMRVEELHEYVYSDGEKFVGLYQRLNSKCYDLSMRWTDFRQQTLLFSATGGGETRSVKLILDCCPNSQPLSNLCSGYTPLLVACRKQNYEKAKLLLDHSPKLLLIQDKRLQNSALHIAVSQRDIQMITTLLHYTKFLLNQGEYTCENTYGLDFIDLEGNTPFFTACSKNYAKIVKMLIDFQKEFPTQSLININKPNGKSQRTALHAAVHNKSMEIINMLLGMRIDINRKAKPTKDLQDHLISGHFNGMHSETRSLVNEISRSAPINSSPLSKVVPESQELLHSVDVSRRKIQMPLRSNAANVIIDEENVIKIMEAFESIHSEAQTKFCDAFITPLTEACVYGSEPIVELLLKHGARDNDGFACRICHFLSNQRLAQLILSFHCVLESDQSEESAVMLQWDSKSLPDCSANWLSAGATFSIETSSKPESNPIVYNAGEFYKIILYGYNSIYTVNLNNNALSSVPIELFHLPNVTKINLSHNRLAQLPTTGATNLCGWSCSLIEELDFSHNSLSQIPICVWVLPKLREIYCGNNHLVTLTLPAMDKASQSLIKADFSQNEVESLHENIWLLKELIELNLASNRLTISGLNFPSNMADKQNVMKYNTSLRTYTHSTKSRYTHYFGGIEEFSIGFQPESDLPSYCYSSLEKLHISDNSLTEFPEALSCIAPNLKELDVSRNEMKCIDIHLIPEFISKLTAIDCKIKYFGNALVNRSHTFIMKSCSSIYARSSLCEHRKHEQLPYLTEINLRENSLTRFQFVYCHASRYSSDTLATTGNKFDPKDSLHLLYPNLITLNLEKNELDGCFNHNVGHQSKLKKLLLSGNHDLSQLPNELGLLNLTRLGILDTPNLIDPQPEYLNITSLEKLEDLLCFLKARMRSSKTYRTIKLFFIGEGGRGKTTLKKRLCYPSMSAKEIKKDTLSTVGIDIEIWKYKPKKAGKEVVKFLMWDFAGQDAYHTTHQCFYSRRSLYLALFRLTDGDAGVEELMPWLKNVKLHAPGCPVVIIGTHRDEVSKKVAIELEQKALQTYSNNHKYPQIVKVTSINSMKMEVFSDMQCLRDLIYDVACHLKRNKENMLHYEPNLNEDDPRALFNEQIPESFIQLQDSIHVQQKQGSDSKPILKKEDFFKEFLNIFDDNIAEMKEAVRFLSYQGTLLHFDDYQVNDLYFLEPQWLVKYMANFIRPGSAVKKDGLLSLDSLNAQFESDMDELKEELKYLLEKFELALTVDDKHKIIPSLMSDEMPYLAFETHNHIGDPYPAPLRRFWLSDYIPDGFWPRLICRIVKDHQISKDLNDLIRRPIKLDDWKFWKTGIALQLHQTRVLFILNQELNKKSSDIDQESIFAKQMRVELHIYFSDFDVEVTDKDKPAHIHGLLTRLLVKISQHIELLTKRWFPGLFEEKKSGSVLTLVPCWKCFVGIDHDKSLDIQEVSKQHSIYKDEKSVFCFVLEENIVNVAQDKQLKCPLHDILEVAHIMPDLKFYDTTMMFKDNESTLLKKSYELLGVGGFGFVFVGESIDQNAKAKTVAVKMFLHNVQDYSPDLDELLRLSEQPEHLAFAYREIRKEVQFLSSLENPFVTELLGVRTSPYTCIMLELAPKGSLNSMLKGYESHGVVLQPLTLKNLALQIAAGLAHLHTHEIVHLDMKSSNILVWYFPSANDSYSVRARQAGNVWIKIADYGISQVCTGLTIKVGICKLGGTDGYIAPETLETGLIKEISAEKVDVFAYGMTLYEMLSFHSPFHFEKCVPKRNQYVCDKKRPELCEKEKRSPILFQDLMAMCWSHEPKERPTMDHVKELLEKKYEFERLRAVVDLGNAPHISCACVCRIVPTTTAYTSITDLVRQSSGHEETCDGQVLNHEQSHESVIQQEIENNDSINYQRNGHFNSYESLKFNEPSTQIWIYKHVTDQELPSKATIYTYQDGLTGCYKRSASFKQAITTTCSVHNMIWMGTESGTIIVVDVTTQTTRYSGKLDESQNSNVKVEQPILDILHMESRSEECVVIVVNKNGMIWSLYEEISPDGFRIHDQLSLSESISSCCHISEVKVKIDSEVWGTMMNNSVFILEKEFSAGYYIEDDGCNYVWKVSGLLSINPSHHEVTNPSHIVQAKFVGRCGSEENHVWISYHRKSVLVSFDTETRKQRCVIDLHDLDQDKILSTENAKVTTMTTVGKKIIVGTVSGEVVILNSEDMNILAACFWHKGEVEALLVIPEEVKPCICAEIPFEEPDDTNAQICMVTENKYNIPNIEPNAAMIASIGKGRISLNASKTSENHTHFLIWKS